MRPDQLDLLVHLGRPAVHPDGSWAVVAASHPSFAADAEVGQLWRVPLDGSGARRLTRGRSDSSPAFTPDGSLLLFLRPDEKGRSQLWMLPVDGGEAQLLTDRPLGVDDFRIAPGGRLVAFTSRVGEPGRYGELDGVDARHEDPRRFDGVQLRSNGLGWYRDRRRHLFCLELPDAFAEPFVEPVGRAARELGDEAGSGLPVAHQLTTGDADDLAPVFRGDDELLFCSSRDEQAGSMLTSEVYRITLDEDGGAAGEPQCLTPQGSLRRDVDQVVVSGENTWLLHRSVGEDGLDFVGRTPTACLLGDEGPGPALVDPSGVALVDAEGDGRGGLLAIRELRGAQQLLHIAPDGRTEELLSGELVVEQAVSVPASSAVLAVVADATGPGELWLVRDGQARALTDFAAPLREATTVVAPRELVATSPDGYPVHGWALVPPGEGPHPVLLTIHGGPHSSYGWSFFDEFQAWVGAGYAVVACNPRGSSGYGVEHGRAIRGALGDRDMVDVLAFLEHALASVEGLDAERLGIQGGSYGGYLTAWTIAHDHRFAAAVVERGYLDPPSFVGSSDIGWFFPAEYHDRDAAAMEAQSPMRLAGQVRTPTLVIHSEEDLRCPVEQGLRYHTLLRQAGVDSELLVFPGENHELTRSGTPWHRRRRMEAVLEWWQRHLPVETTSPQPAPVEPATATATHGEA